MMLDWILGPKCESEVIGEMPDLVAERHRRVWEHIERIERAVEEAGLNTEMLNYLPPGHISAALALHVK